MLWDMDETPAFLDLNRPGVPDIAVPRGVSPFYLPLRPVRGRLIRLGVLADALVGRHDYPEPVGILVGEALALVAALATALKFSGSFSLQAKGDGPVKMLLADCTDIGGLRGYASIDHDKLAALLAEHPQPDAAQLLGTGYLVFTVDQGPDMDRHQGVVALTGDRLEDMALHYFEASEQTHCFIRLASQRSDTGWRASALVLERIAGAGGIDPEMDALAQDDSWATALVLAGTIKNRELLDEQISAERLLWNLFGTEGVALDRPRALNYGCRCSRAKLAGILGTFGGEDLDDMVHDGAIVMTCEFCNLDFRFSRDDIAVSNPT
jgi:molecular chaperone Hsp33